MVPAQLQSAEEALKVPSDPEPKIVHSAYAGSFEKNGFSVKVSIFRFEDEEMWTLEVIDAQGNSTIWDEGFATDSEAWNTFLRTIEVDGIESFVPP